MVLSGGAIAGISVAGTIILAILAWIIYVVIRRRRRNAEYLHRCDHIYQNYGRASENSEVVAKFPFADPSYVKTPLPGQKFTTRELNQKSSDVITALYKSRKISDEERRPFASETNSTEQDDTHTNQFDYGTGENTALGHTSQEDYAEILYTLFYGSSTRQLSVHIKQAKNLPLHRDSKLCFPYVSLMLLPSGEQGQQTQVKRNTTSPFYDEWFNFDFQNENLKETTLEIRVFAYDEFSFDECIGTINHQLDDLKYDSEVHYQKKIESEKSEKNTQKAGELLLRLGYQTVAEKLTVVLLKVRSLKKVGPIGVETLPDPYIRVAIIHDGNLLKKKKTSTKKKTCDPTFNQAINFSIPIQLLPQIEIQFDVVHEDNDKILRSERKEIIGSLEISPHSTGEEKEHWKDLMSNKPQARWHDLILRQIGHQFEAEEEQKHKSFSDTQKFTNVT